MISPVCDVLVVWSSALSLGAGALAMARLGLERQTGPKGTVDTSRTRSKRQKGLERTRDRRERDYRQVKCTDTGNARGYTARGSLARVSDARLVLFVCAVRYGPGREGSKKQKLIIIEGVAAMASGESSKLPADRRAASG